MSSFNNIEEIIETLTLDEKLNLVGQYRACTTYSIPEKGIPSISLADGATGVNGTHIILDAISKNKEDYQRLEQRFYQTDEFENLLTANLEEVDTIDEDLLHVLDSVKNARPNGKQFICFPSGVVIGASFSKKQAYKMGSAVACELRDSGFDVCYGPNVDIARDPLGGRNYEMYGEDPCLVEQMTVGFIEGMQENGVAACPKHFIANNQETSRNHSNAFMSKRTLNELYARGFEAAVREANARAIMTAYSALNGTFSSFNSELMIGLARDEWGFEGVFVNDWGAVDGKETEALKAGIDLLLCGPMDMSQVKQEVEENPDLERMINEHIRRTLKLTFDLKNDQKKNPLHYQAEELLEDAIDTICEGSVLLKNKKSVLPLKMGEKIAFYGNRSKKMIAYGSGSTKVTTKLHTNPYEECMKYTTNISFESIKDCDTVIYTVGSPAGENMDREAMDIELEDRKRITTVLKDAKSKGLKTIVILNVSGPVTMEDWREYADSILCVFIPGSMGGRAISDMLFGNRMPTGKLPVTFPKRYEDTPAFPNFPSEGRNVYYGEEIFVGYRNYDKRKFEVEFPFGYGLSYTEFDCQLIDCPSKVNTRQDEKFSVEVKVKNIGSYSSAEVIQLYAGQVTPKVTRPEKELIGFQKVWLEPGEEKVITIDISIHSLSYFDEKQDKFVIPIGEYRLSVGTSSRDLFAEVYIEVKGENPYTLGGDSSIAEVLENPQAIKLINKYTNNLFDIVNEEQLKFMVDLKVSELLSGILISAIPDSNKVDQILSKLYEELKKL